MVGSYETRFLFGANLGLSSGVRTVRFREVGSPANPPNLSTWRRLLMWMISLIPAAGSEGLRNLSFFWGRPKQITKISVWRHFICDFSYYDSQDIFHVFLGLHWTVQIPFCRFISPLANLNKNMLSICRIDAQVTIRKTDMELVEDHCNLLIWRISHFP